MNTSIKSTRVRKKASQTPNPQHISGLHSPEPTPSIARTVQAIKSTDSLKRQSNLEKIKGLEEIGIFSEFIHSKRLIDRYHLENPSTQATIHITDFMKNDQKTKLLRIAGGWKAYELKRGEYKKGLYNRDLSFKNFFTPSEKLPSYFNSPQASPRSFKDVSSFSMQKSLSGRQLNERVLGIDSIIEKCDEAIKLKPKGHTSYTTIV